MGQKIGDSGAKNGLVRLDGLTFARFDPEGRLVTEPKLAIMGNFLSSIR